MESMSNAPYLLKKARFGYKLGDGTLIDHMTYDGPPSTFDKQHMVEQASFVSRELGISARSRTSGRCARTSARFARSTRAFSPTRSRRSTASQSTRGAAPRHVAREARLAEAGLRPGGDDDRRQRAGRERRRRLRHRHVGGVRRRSAGSRCSRRSSRRHTSPTTSPTSRARRPRPATSRSRSGEIDRRRRARGAQRGVLVGRRSTR